MTALCKRYLDFLDKMLNDFCAASQAAKLYSSSHRLNRQSFEELSPRTSNSRKMRMNSLIASVITL